MSSDDKNESEESKTNYYTNDQYLAKMEHIRKQARERQKSYRQRISEEKREEIKNKNRESTKLSRKILNEDKKEHKRKLARERQRRYFNKLNDEKKEEIRKRDREKHKRYYHKNKLNENEVKTTESEKQLLEPSSIVNKRRENLKQNNSSEESNVKIETLVNEDINDILQFDGIKMSSQDSTKENILKNECIEYSYEPYSDEIHETFPPTDDNQNIKCQCYSCGIILSDHEKLIQHIKENHYKEYNLIEKLRSNVIIIQKIMAMKDIKTIENERQKSANEQECSLIVQKEDEILLPETIINNSLKGGKSICNKCGLVISCDDLLDCHMKMKHLNDEPIMDDESTKEIVECPICDENSTIGKIYCHINTVHLLKPNTPYKCDECGLVFVAHDYLLRHYKLKQNTLFSVNRKICDLYDCSYVINNEECKKEPINKLDDLETSGEKEKIYKCKLCDYKNSYSFPILKHILKSHFDLFECSLECPFCNVKSKHNDIKKHIKSVHPNTITNIPLVCEMCGYTTYKKNTFNNHRLSHIKRYDCEFCDYTTSLMTSINVHKMQHTKQKPYKCDYQGCQYETSKKLLLSTHQCTHYPEKYMQTCEKCNFKTTNKYIMRSHVKDHQQRKEIFFTCVQCPYSTNLKTNLLNHSSVHKDPTPCTLCDFATKYNQAMRKHMKTKHGVITARKSPKKITNCFAEC